MTEGTRTEPPLLLVSQMAGRTRASGFSVSGSHGQRARQCQADGVRQTRLRGEPGKAQGWEDRKNVTSKN